METTPVFFEPSEVKIFEYYNGESITAADPYDIMLQIASFDDFDWDLAFGTFIKQEMDIESGQVNPRESAEAARMTMELIDKIRTVLQIKPLRRLPDGSYEGLGGSQVLKVLMDWHSFLSNLKKTDVDTATLPANTDSDGLVEN